MDKYNQITEEERYQNRENKKSSFSVPRIAKELNRNKSTINRKLKRNSSVRGCSPKQANDKAKQRKSESTKSIKITTKLTYLIDEKLCLDWSPKQIVV
jgi:IS30 family transposase